VRNKAKPKNRILPPSGRVYNPNRLSADQEQLHKNIAEFEKFKTELLPALQKDLLSGATAPELREKYLALVQARLISEALTNPDAAKAAAAAMDIINRAEGKAVEKRETKHTFENLKDEEVDAILKSEIEELEDMAERFDS
jgi:DNA replication protein DnaD